MKNHIARIIQASLIVLVLSVLYSCDANDGTLEKAGESIDKAATDFGNKIEDECEELKEGLKVKDPRC